MAKGTKHEIVDGLNHLSIDDSVESAEHDALESAPALSEIIPDSGKSVGDNNGKTVGDSVVPEKSGMVSFRPSVTYGTMGVIESFEKRFPNLDRAIITEMAIVLLNERFGSLLATTGKLDRNDETSKQFASLMYKVWANRGADLI